MTYIIERRFKDRPDDPWAQAFDTGMSDNLEATVAYIKAISQHNLFDYRIVPLVRQEPIYVEPDEQATVGRVLEYNWG